MWDEDRDAYRAELKRFVDLHARTMEPLRAGFQTVVSQGPAVWLQSALSRIDGLPSLAAAPEATAVGPEPGAPKLGMCGLLRPLDVSTAV